MLEAWDQAIAQWAGTFGEAGEAAFRLICAAIAGAVIGMERELRGRLAGFRTNMLVCIGSALVMVVSISFSHHQWRFPEGIRLQIDPARIAYGVMTGIGFLGAGTIMQARGSIRGLTTAAALWCLAAIGLALGFGLYIVAAMATLLIVVVLWLMDYLEAVIPKKQYRRITVRRPWSAGCVRETIDQVKALGIAVEDASFHRQRDDSSVEITLLIMYLRRQQYYDFEQRLSASDQLEFLASHD